MCAEDKIAKLCSEVERFALFIIIEPQAAYAAFIQSEMQRFTYFLRTIPSMKKYEANLLRQVCNDVK